MSALPPARALVLPGLLLAALVIVPGLGLRADSHSGGDEASEEVPQAEISTTPPAPDGAEAAKQSEEAEDESEDLPDIPTDPKELWGLLLENQQQLHTLVKTRRKTVEILDEIAALSRTSSRAIRRISETVELERVPAIRLKRSGRAAMLAASSLAAHGRSHIPGGIRVPLHTYDIQLKVLEEKLPESVVAGRPSREPEDIDVTKHR